MSRCGLQDAGGAAICSSLLQQDSVRELHLGWNALSSATAQAVEAVLRYAVNCGVELSLAETKLKLAFWDFMGLRLSQPGRAVMLLAPCCTHRVVVVCHVALFSCVIFLHVVAMCLMQARQPQHHTPASAALWFE
jgi:hypothetical protein